MANHVVDIGKGVVWQVGGPKGHGAELMINIAIVSMYAILYIDRDSWPHLCDG